MENSKKIGKNIVVFASDKGENKIGWYSNGSATIKNAEKFYQELGKSIEQAKIIKFAK